MRVVSLLPAATEIVAALGMLDQLVGVSHECDYPLEAQAKPRVTRCAIHGGALASEEADRWVSDTLAGSGTLYTLDEALVRRLAPALRRARVDRAALPQRPLDARAGRDRGRHGAARPHGRGRGARPVGGGRRRRARGARARLLRLRPGAHGGRRTAPRDAPGLGG